MRRAAGAAAAHSSSSSCCRAGLARRPPSLLSALTVGVVPRRRWPAGSTVAAAARPSSSPSPSSSTSSNGGGGGVAASSSSKPSSASTTAVAPPAATAAASPSPSAAAAQGGGVGVDRLMDPISGPRLIHESLAARPGLCDSGLPDPEMCLLDDDDPEMVAEDLVVGAVATTTTAAAAAAAPAATTAVDATTQQQQQQHQLPSPLHVPPAPDGSVLDEAASRGRWLVGLLVVQSLSSVVLERFEPLIREHLAVTLFLTMLVGAGGNAGNQSAIKVVRSLATGQLDASWPSARAALARQAGVAVVLGGGLAAAGYVRVIVAAAIGGLGGGAGTGAAAVAGAEAANDAAAAATAATALSWADASRDAAAIAVSLLCIVVASVMLGTALPFLLARCGLDAAHSGTTIQVASDVLGVLVTCLACSFFYSGALDGVTDGIGAALAWVF